MCLQMMKDDEQAYQKILARMDKFLTENRDRVLFGFVKLPAEPKTNQQDFYQED